MARLLSPLERNLEAALQLEPDILQAAVARSCRIKAAVVAEGAVVERPAPFRRLAFLVRDGTEWEWAGRK